MDKVIDRTPMEFEVESRFGFDETVERLQAAVAENKMTVLHVHPMSKTLSDKGFPRDPLSLIEVCNARQASLALQDDLRVALMMPCPIAVFVREGGVYASTMDTRILSRFYEGSRLQELGLEMYEALKAILGTVAKSA